MKTNLLILTLFSLVSCGADYSGDATPIESDIGKVINAEAVIKDGELTSAQRICYALRSMRTKFRSDFLNYNFSFKVDNKTCTSNAIDNTVYTVDTKLIVPYQQGPMIYDSNTTNFYYSDVQTNKEGHLATICEDILAGRETTNTIQETQRQRKQMTFSTNNSSFKVSYAAERPSPNGPQFIIYKSEVFTVKTGSDSGDNLGLVEKIEMVEECSSEDSTTTQSSFIQTFVSRTSR